MNQSVKVTKKDIKPILDLSYPDYTGKKFSVEFTTKVTFWDTNWDGGTKNDYCFVGFNGNAKELPDNFAPWANPIEGKSIDLPENVLVVNRMYFCGKDLGIRIYSHPCHAPKFLEDK